VDFSWRAGLEFSDECRFRLARREGGLPTPNILLRLIFAKASAFADATADKSEDRSNIERLTPTPNFQLPKIQTGNSDLQRGLAGQRGLRSL